MLLLLSSCGVKKTIEPIILHDSAAHTDSVRIAFTDSIFMRITADGDTEPAKEIHWRVIDKSKTDSIYIEVPVISTEYKPYIPTWVWYLVIVAAVIILLTVARIAFWIYRKFFLHL